MLSNWAVVSTQPCFPANPILTQRSFRFWEIGFLVKLTYYRVVVEMSFQILRKSYWQKLGVIASANRTSGSLKLFWIGVDPSRHGIMLGAFRRLVKGMGRPDG
jgi:hypothetical protein